MRKCGLAVAALAVLVSAAEWLAGMSLCGGELCYPLDDTYIHLAMARQLAESGTWGLEAGVPVFASSSPLWTVLLAAAVMISSVSLAGDYSSLSDADLLSAYRQISAMRQ